VAVGLGFNKARAIAGARARERTSGCLEHELDIVAVNDDRLEPIGLGTISRRVLDSRHFVDRCVLHVHVVLANEHDRQLPDHGKIQRFVKRADVRRAVTEETHGRLLRAAILRRPRCTRGDRQMRADDCVGPHGPVLDTRQVHRTALAPHESAFASHKLAQNASHRGAAQHRMVMPAIRAKRVVVGAHRCSDTGGDGLLAEREMARTLDKVLHEQIVGALFHLPCARHHAVKLEPQLVVDGDYVATATR